MVISIPITYLSARFIVKKSQPYFKQQADVLGAMNGFVQENLTGFNILKLYVREEVRRRIFDNYAKTAESSLKLALSLV